MGFFTSTALPVSTSAKKTISVDEDYVRRAIRTPSAAELYVNPVFEKSFQKFRKMEPHEPQQQMEVTNEPELTFKKRNRLGFDFCWWFRKEVPQIANQVALSGFDSDKKNIIPQTGLVAILSEDESRDEEVETNESNRYTRELDTSTRFSTSNALDSSIKTPTRLSIRERFFGVRKKHKNLKREGITVYDVQETLTQRYMKNNYENLIAELDSYSYDSSQRTGQFPTFSSISRALRSLRPGKNQSNDIGQLVSCLTDTDDDDKTNPYEIAKNAQTGIQQLDKKVDRINTNPDKDSNESALEETNWKGNSSKTRKFTNFFRKFSKKFTLRAKFLPIVSDDDTYVDEFSVSYRCSANFENHLVFKSNELSQSRFNPLEELSSTTLVKDSSDYTKMSVKIEETEETETEIDFSDPFSSEKIRSTIGIFKDPITGSIKLSSSPQIADIFDDIYAPNKRIIRAFVNNQNEKGTNKFNKTDFGNILNKFRDQINDSEYQERIRASYLSEEYYASDSYSSQYTHSSYSSIQGKRTNSCDGVSPQPSIDMNDHHEAMERERHKLCQHFSPSKLTDINSK